MADQRGLVRAAVLASTLLLAGCSSSSGRSLPPLPTPTASASDSASAAPAEEFTPAGAIAFVRAYYEGVNTAFATGAVGALASMSLPTCSCRRVVHYVSSVYQNGRITGGGYVLIKVTDQTFARGVAEVSVAYEGEAGAELDKSGAVVYRLPAVQNGSDEVTLVWVHGKWLISSVVILTPKS